MLDTYISDHKTICIALDLLKPIVYKKFSHRQLKKLIFLNLMKILQLLFLMSKISTLTPLYSFFNSTLTLTLNKYAPLKQLLLLLVMKIHGLLLTS